MTIDERLEKLTERHEALAQTMELTAIENRERDVRIDKLTANVEKLTGLVEKLVTTSEQTLQIARNHEARLQNLEGQ